MISVKSFALRTAACAFFLFLALSGAGFAATADRHTVSDDGRYILGLDWLRPSRLLTISGDDSSYADAYNLPLKIRKATISSDGRYIAAINEEQSDVVLLIYDTEKKTQITRISGAKENYARMGGDIWFSRDGTSVYTEGRHQLARTDIFTGRMTDFENIPGLDNFKIRKLCSSPDGKYIAVLGTMFHFKENTVNPISVFHVIAYDLSTMKPAGHLAFDEVYDGESGPSADLYFSDDSRFLNLRYSAPDPGVSNLFNIFSFSYGKGTRQYAVPGLALAQKDLELRPMPEVLFEISNEWLIRRSDRKEFRITSSPSNAFVQDDAASIALRSSGRDLTSAYSRTYSAFPPGMSERMKKSASGNGRYSDLRQVIESTDTKRADAWLRDDELKGYGTTQFSGVKSDPGYRVFISPYLFVWRTEQAPAAAKKDTAPKIETEFVSVKGMNYGRHTQYDLLVEVRYEKQTFMIGGLNLVYKQIRSASVTEYRFSGLNADWTKLSPAPPAYMEEDKKKWEDRNTPLFYVRINLLDIWFSLPGFKAE